MVMDEVKGGNWRLVGKEQEWVWGSSRVVRL